MRKIRLFQKFLATFLGLILFPFMLILIILLIRSSNLELRNDLSQNEILTTQTANTILRQAELAENMCKSVIQNQAILNFLDTQFNSSTDLLYYMTTINNFVEVTNGVSDIRLRLYLENKSIPSGFGTFFPLSRVNNTQTFRDFYTDTNMESIWLHGNFDETLSDIQRVGTNVSYHYFLKIRVGSHLLGVIEAMVPERVFEITDELSLTTLEPMKLPNGYLYNFSGLPLDEDDIEMFLSGAKSVSMRNFVYTHRNLPSAPFDIIVVSARNQQTLSAFTLAVFLPALFSILMAGFFFYNRRIIRDLHSCLDGMEFAIKNGFDLSSPPKTAHTLEMISRRNDELSTLADRINYLLQLIRKLLDQTVREQTAAKDAELLALQHQINPHFLYNTMEVFSSRMELAGLYEESDAVSAFCKMLRYNMNTKELMTTLADEIQQVEYYLRIQKIRNIPFSIHFDIPEELLQEQCIRFLLEPFVENSFKYRNNDIMLQILISAQMHGNDILISIRNNGNMMSKKQVSELNEKFRTSPASMKTGGQHIGLNNINSRLKLFYGEQHFIHVVCEEGILSFSFSIGKKSASFSFQSLS